MLQLVSSVNQPADSGIMIPIPHYPVFSTILDEFNIEQIDYFLDGDNDWALDIDELERALHQGRRRCNVSGIVIINPGNPGGKVRSIEQI